MPADDHDKDNDVRAERTNTDLSLEAERRKADLALARRRARDETREDEVVKAARKRADRVLEGARLKADDRLEDEASSAALGVLKDERTNQDAVVRDERATADQSLSHERTARRRALAALLALEREQTDHHLLLERDSADVAIGSRDEFLALVSHDLRNLLGAMAMSAESLLSIKCEGDVQEQVSAGAVRIQRYTSRMNRLVGDLLDVVSIEAGHLALLPCREDAAELLRETVELYQPVAAAREIKIHTEVKGGGPLIADFDHGRVLQVLGNLIGNSIKFTPQGGRIDIVVAPGDNEVCFSVTDTGTGIATDQLENVFKRFLKVDTPPRSGVGLGLYISRCIVEAHGGKLWAESQPGEGSTFTFTLPTPAEGTTPPENEVSAAGDSKCY